MPEDRDIIAKTLLDYADNRREIACMEKRLSDIGDVLVQFGEELRNTPANITVTPTGFQLPFGRWTPVVGHTVDVADTSFDVAPVREILMRLLELQERDGRLRNTLEQMGYSHILQQP